MQVLRALGLVGLVVLGYGCGEGSFGGAGGRQSGGSTGAKTGGTSSSDAVPEELPAKDAVPENPTKEQEAIGRCLKAWGNSPFDATVYDTYRHVAAAVTVLGAGNAVVDEQVTDKPELVVVTASVNVLGSANYVLMNPNGWYCLMVGVNVQAKTNIDMQCKAKLADSRVQVDVLSKSTAPNAAIGVNVLSDVKVRRMPSRDSNEGC